MFRVLPNIWKYLFLCHKICQISRHIPQGMMERDIHKNSSFWKANTRHIYIPSSSKTSTFNVNIWQNWFPYCHRLSRQPPDLVKQKQNPKKNCLVYKYPSMWLSTLLKRINLNISGSNQDSTPAYSKLLNFSLFCLQPWKRKIAYKR